MRNSINIALLVTLCVVGAYGSLPNYLEKCKAGEKECILKNVNTIFHTKTGGDKAFGIRQFDPLELKTMDIIGDPQGSVRVDLKFKNIIITGLKTGTFTNVKGFGKNPEGRHDLLLKLDRLDIKAEYTVNGNVIILPVQGNGDSSITLLKPQLKVSIEAGKKEKDGKIYMDPKNSKLDVIIDDRINYRFDNLFNGDKALGDNMNTFLNENWREIFEDIKPSFLRELNKPLFETIKKVFEITPYAEIFDV